MTGRRHGSILTLHKWLYADATPSLADLGSAGCLRGRGLPFGGARRRWHARRRSRPPCATAKSALAQLVGQLDTLLAKLRDPDAPLDRQAPDSLRAATVAADAALARVRRLPTR